MRIPRPQVHHLLIAGLLGALAAASILIRGPVRGASERPVPTTLSTEPGGLQGLYMVCEGLGIPVDRYTGRLADLDPQTVPALAVIGDADPEVDPAPLLEWVHGGGRLLLASRDARLLLPLGLATGSKDSMVRKVVLEGRAASWGIPGPIPPPEKSIRFPAEIPGEVLARAKGPEDERPLVLVLSRGRGRVVFVADPDLLVNASLDDPARAVLAARLVEEAAAGERIRFCETIHGFGQAGNPQEAMARVLLRTPFGNAVLGGAVFLLLMLLAEAKRFGRVRRTLEAPRRSEYEYLDALAGLLLAGRAWRQAGGLLLLGARRRIGREVRAGTRTSARSVAEALAWDRPADGPALREGAEALAAGKDPQAMVRGLAALDRALPPDRKHGEPGTGRKEGT